MNLKLRKLYVWLISLGVILVIYFLYNQLNKTPQINTDIVQGESISSGDNGNVIGSGGEIGMIGKVGVKAVQKARYLHLNADKQLDREFGFEKLLYERGNEWEIEKPFMNIFRPDIKCSITADKGTVKVETALGRPNPKDATFTENVVIHIQPENNSNIQESFIYLDDVVFSGEKSQFSTDGPVKFISTGAEMLGTGLELIYNDQASQLELFRIVHLESLHLKPFTKASSPSASQTDIAIQPETEPPAESITNDIQKTQTSSPPEIKGKGYRCIFKKNVVIDCPEQLVFADEISISNINSNSRKDVQLVNSDDTEDDYSEPENHTSQTTADQQQLLDVVITCDGGIIVTPMSTSILNTNEDSSELNKDSTIIHGGKNPSDFGDSDTRPTFAADRIDYCLAENKVVMEGNCICTMVQDGSDIRKKHTLSAPKVTVKLSRNKDERFPDSEIDIEHLSASGQTVKLSTIKMAKQTSQTPKNIDRTKKLLGGVELKCLKFDYFPVRELFIATGPGVIKVDNSQISEQKIETDKADKFSLRKPCYAIVRNFDTLEYSMETNQVIADSESQEIVINYIPVTEVGYGQQALATAGRIEAILCEAETNNNITELSTLRATGGVTYEEEGKKSRGNKTSNIQFVGSEFFYDADRSMITVRGDDIQPCYFNNALVSGIEYNLKTGKAKTKITAPGTFQLGK